jgi:hypothetical protein
MGYAEFEPAIPVDSVNIFAVYYRHTTRAACHNLPATTLQRAAKKYAAVPAPSVPSFLLFTR